MEYNIGDFVFLKRVGKKVLYIVADRMAYIKTFRGEAKKDYEYDLIQVYPVTSYLKFEVALGNDIVLRSSFLSKQHEADLNFVLKKYDEKKASKEWMQIVDDNIELEKKYNNDAGIKNGKLNFGENLISSYTFIDVHSGETFTIGNNKNIDVKQKYDKIHYSLLQNIDECLDAMNDLKELHEQFGDEEYIENYNNVLKRLKELV